MKKLIILLLIITGCSSHEKGIREMISLAGEWGFRIDSLDQGVKDSWFNQPFIEKVKLPGSMAENGKGNEVTVNTDWTGEIVDRSYFTDKKYEKYRQPGDIKIPFWLKPVKYYKGAAWYSKEIDLPDSFKGKRVILFLERCHWESTLYVNGKKAGTQNSLSTPHEYEISGLLKKGKNSLCIRIDNRIIIPVGVNSHSISDHTQTDWNGITGEIDLRTTSKVYLSDVTIYPDVSKKEVKVVVKIGNAPEQGSTVRIELQPESLFPGIKARKDKMVIEFENVKDKDEFNLIYSMGNNAALWSEFSPALYNMNVTLKDEKGNPLDKRSVLFGMREFRAHGTRFEVNGTPAFLRGTTECCVFPLTGYPPSDTASWVRIFKICRDYGLNHMRFHSYCPPEAAFIAADKEGIYLHIECSSWANSGTTIGDSTPVDRFIYDESDRILKEYGNHPSFCMLAYGNEPAGKNQEAFLGSLIRYWKSKDKRRAYTSAAGWPIIPENDYNLTAEPRIQHWGEGLKSIINRESFQTMFDFRDYVSKYTIPVVSHEIGQWCVYPDFTEIEKYKGVLKPTNLEIFRETLTENHMGEQAKDFLQASGNLQVLCYKADIEAALRTPGFAGFQMLQLHDFPGQGTALVGILNPFFESKGYVTPEEFRMFCSQTVPLARMKKMVFRNNETFSADLEVAHFGGSPMGKSEFVCQVTNENGDILKKEILARDTIEIGNCIPIGHFEMNLAKTNKAQKLTFEVFIYGTHWKNRWDFWVYPSDVSVEKGKVLITDKFNTETENYLKSGGSVLFLTCGKIKKDRGADVAIGFSTIFWNTAWTNNQPPHTMGVLCNPWHPVFNNFPTEAWSTAQWWDIVSYSQVMILDDFPGGLVPLIQPIDTWFENRRLALAFEARSGNGKLMVCSVDLNKNIEDRPAAKQLLASVLDYMNSNAFKPQIEIETDKIKALLK